MDAGFCARVCTKNASPVRDAVTRTGPPDDLDNRLFQPLARSLVLELDVDEHAAREAGERLLQRGDALTGSRQSEAHPGIKLLELAQRHRAREAGAIGCPIDIAVVDHDRHAVSREIHVELDAIARQTPGFSGFHRDGRYEESPSVHVGVAVALRGGGLVAPAIMDTADKPLAVLMEEFRALVSRARAGRLRASELAAPTIILTSLGDASVDAADFGLFAACFNGTGNPAACP